MNNVIMRKLVLSDSYQPLVTQQLVASVTISTPPDNTANAIFEGDDGSEVPWCAGEWHLLYSVDLSQIRVKGMPGDVVTVVGGTW